MPHCPLTKASPFSPRKRRCEKSALLHIHCSYLKYEQILIYEYVFALVPHKSLAAVSIPQPLESRGSVMSLVPLWVRAGPSTLLCSRINNFHLLCSPLIWGAITGNQSVRHKDLCWNTCDLGNASFWYEFQFCDEFFSLNRPSKF